MKKKRKIKEFWHKKFFVVSVDMFDTEVGFCVNAKEKEIKKWLKRLCTKEKYSMFNEEELHDWDDSKTNLGRMIPFAGGFIVLLKADREYFRKFVGVLSHEVLHVTHYLLRKRNIPLTEESEEVYTYLTEFIIKDALYKLY